MALKTSALPPENLNDISEAEMEALAVNLNAIEPGGVHMTAFDAISVDFYVLLNALAVLSICGLIVAISILSVPLVRQLYKSLHIRL